MEIRFSWNNARYVANITEPIDIAIPLKNGEAYQPNAYGAPFYQATPVRSGEFVGSLDAGAPVNFFNIFLNPHGNGTHTECVSHILKGPYSIRDAMTRSLWIAQVISIQPKEIQSGMQVTRDQFEALRIQKTDALIVRTLPNPEQKKSRKYTGTNPPWFDPAAMQWVLEQGYKHLLTDLPSVDPEEDGGALASHKVFWNIGQEVRQDCTITELVYVPENVPDGLYLLDLHTVALELDVSPSRPMLYVMQKENEN